MASSRSAGRLREHGWGLSRPSGRPAAGAALALLGLVVAGCSDAGPEIALEIVAPTSTEVVVGDFLTLTASASGTVAGLTWTTSDERVARVVAGTVEALRPGSTTITVSAPDAMPDQLDVTVVARPGGYTADEVDYFGEIAFGAEFGGPDPLLRRWRTGSGPLIRVNGSPTAADRVVLDSVIAEINRLALLEIEIVSDFPTVEMHFVPQSQFQSILPEAPPGNNGLVWLWWGADQYVNRSVVLISTAMGQALRDHVIREEVTQMLGLLQDSFLYPESIFYQGSSQTTAYLPIDRVVIELLHRAELAVGMTQTEGLRVARTLVRSVPGAGARWRAGPPRDAPPRGAPGSGGSGARRAPER